jgi:hypothetical protein
MDIYEKINQLEESEILNFRKEVIEVLYDRSWCFANGIDYSNPNVTLVNEKVFKQMYEK